MFTSDQSHSHHKPVQRVQAFIGYMRTCNHLDVREEFVIALSGSPDTTPWHKCFAMDIVNFYARMNDQPHMTFIHRFLASVAENPTNVECGNLYLILHKCMAIVSIFCGDSLKNTL